MKLLSEMRALCSAKNWKRLEDAAHSLKGAAMQVGARRLGHVALRVERIANSNDMEAPLLQGLMDELDKLFNATLAHLGIVSQEPVV